MTTHHPIEFVYFDLGNILLSFDPELACRNLADRLSVSVAAARSAVYASGLQDQFEHGQLSPQAFAIAVCDQLGVPCQTDQVAVVLDAVSEMFVPIEPMDDVLQQVRDAGYRIGILSNTCHAHWDWIARQSYPVLGGKFETTVLSYEVGAMKPAAAIYAAAEQAAGVAPQRILFVDDRHDNIQAAVDRGWQAAQCFGGPAAIEVLQRFGVLRNGNGV